MNEEQFTYKYVPLGYELRNTGIYHKPKETENDDTQQIVESAEGYAQTNFLNLPDGFKLNG